MRVDSTMLVLCMSRKYKATMDHKSINFHMGWMTQLMNEAVPVTGSIIITKNQNCFWL